MKPGVVLLVAASLAGVPAPRLEMELGPGEPTVGDRVSATLTLTLPVQELQGEPRFPAWREQWGEAEILEVGEVERTRGRDGEVVYRQHLVMTAFRPGRVPLPPVRVAVPLGETTVSVSTPEDLALEIRSVLPEDPEGLEPRPQASPRALPVGRAFWWTAGVLGAACLLAGLLLARREGWGKILGESEVSALEPLPELLSALEGLASEPSPERAHTELSLALRRYLGRTLHFPAAESTTTEIQRQLASRHLPRSVAQPAVQILRECDLVKFARCGADWRSLEQRIGMVRQAARELTAYLAPPVAAEEAA